MLVATDGGNTYTFDEIRKELADAGFIDVVCSKPESIWTVWSRPSSHNYSSVPDFEFLTITGNYEIHRVSLHVNFHLSILASKEYIKGKILFH